MKYKVMIADDYKMIRQMIESMIDSTGKYEVVCNAATAEEAISNCEQYDIDLAILDVVMGSDTDGIEAAAQIKKISPKTKIIVVTSMAESSYISRSMDAGVESFWHKELQEQPLLEIIERTMNGESVYPSTTVETWFGDTVNTSLTARELDVLRALVHGDSNAEIADKLGITERTVKKHISDMLIKTGFKSRLQLAVRARAGGIAVND